MPNPTLRPNVTQLNIADSIAGVIPSPTAGDTTIYLKIPHEIWITNFTIQYGTASSGSDVILKEASNVISTHSSISDTSVHSNDLGSEYEVLAGTKLSIEFTVADGADVNFVVEYRRATE